VQIASFGRTREEEKEKVKRGENYSRYLCAFEMNCLGWCEVISSIVHLCRKDVDKKVDKQYKIDAITILHNQPWIILHLLL
jgi:hypothetical protein